MGEARSQATYRAVDSTPWRADELVAALEALAAEPPPADPILLAAVAGAQEIGHELVELLAENRVEPGGETYDDPAAEQLGTPAAWQAEGALEACRQHAQLVVALTGRVQLERVAALTYSPAYAAHRRAVEEAIGHAVPQLALVEVALTHPLGETINGWLPPYGERPWAIALTRPVETGGRFDRTLLHELVHAAQVQFLYPVLDDKELEWVLGVGNRTLIEGATETLIEQIAGAPCSEFYLVETRTLIRLATRLQMTPLELARRVSASSYPLDVVADLWGSNDEQLAWEILIVNDEEREQVRANA